ncbi:MAG: DNA-binding response regulator PetR, partial [uncultured Microvirga sp.]
ERARARRHPRSCASCAGRRRRSPAARASGAFSLRARLPRDHCGQRGRGAGAPVHARLRRHRARRDDAGRDRVRVRPLASPRLADPDPHAHGAFGVHGSGQRPRNRRRRLPLEAVRAPRAVAQARQYPEARGAERKRGRKPGRRNRALRPVRLPLRPRGTAPGRRTHPHHRARARDPVHPRPACGRQRGARGTGRRGERRERAHGGRPDHPASAQDRTRPGQSGLSPDGARRRLPAPERL